MQLMNITNHAAFGMAWRGKYGTCYELFVMRGTGTLRLSTRAAGSNDWSTTEVDRPERFMTDPPRTSKAMREIAHAFIAGTPAE